MGRVPRWRMGEGVYHVFNRGINKSWVLSDAGKRQKFLALLADHRRNFNVEIYHYALMSNHFHLAVEALDMKELSAYIGGVCSQYGKWWRGVHGAGVGPLWQGRYRSVAVQKELYLNRLGRYIERNPIAAGIDGIDHPADYEWSSAAAYVVGKPDALVRPDRHPYWGNWGPDDADRRRDCAAYPLDANEEEDDANNFESGAAFLGDETFAAKLGSVSGRLVCGRRGRPRKAQYDTIFPICNKHR